MGAPPELEERILILALERDGPLTRDILGRAGLQAEVCLSPAGMAREVERGAGVLILAEEVMRADQMETLQAALDQQPAWSDLPIILVTKAEDCNPRLRAFPESLRSVMALGRPLRLDTLVTAIQSALRARRRQYVVRDLLYQRQEYLAMLAHELRNPLAPILSGVQVLRAKPDPQRQERILNVIDKQTRHLSRLVDDLLDTARLQKSRVQLRLERLEARSQIQDIAAAFEDGLQASGHTLRLDLAPAEVWLHADPVRLEQIVTNLLLNAAKYTPAGCSILITVASAGNRGIIRVEDDGPGVAPEHLVYLKDPFVQTPRSIARSEGGLGLGLAVAAELVHLHEGELEVRNVEPGSGLCAEVRLPLAGNR